MVFLPFISITVGVIIGFNKQVACVAKWIDPMINTALMVLMITLGAQIGSNETLVGNLGLLGLRCIIIALSAISFSVLMTLILEKTILPLEKIQKKLSLAQIGINEEEKLCMKDHASASIVIIIPICLISGVILGYLLNSDKLADILSQTLVISLVILYIGVGISFGMNRRTFKYIYVLGWKMILIPVSITLGSIIGGVFSGFVLKMPYFITVSSACGMSYYSITGACMTQAFGIEAGAYGFLVNVMREFLTVLFLPLLIKISKASPIASGAAGNMDTMLVPVTKFVGIELGLVALITGTILTFLVPILLPIFLSINI